MVASLHHPHIVQVHNYGEHEGLPYIAMELIEGGSLADRLDGAPWPPRRAAALLAKLADAMQFAHERKVIHRDLKPANVLIASDAKELDVKITDFGLAKCFFDESSLHTGSFAFLGTPSYMAPEQANGQTRDIGPPADIYSLGAILYELLTGQPPYRSESPIETLRLLLSTEPVSIHRLFPTSSTRSCHHLRQVLAGAMRSTLCDRPRSCARISSAIWTGKPIHARPVGSAERAWRWSRRNPLLAAALGSVAMLLVSIAAVSLWYSGQLRHELVRTKLAEQSERAAKQTAQSRLWDAYVSEAMARNASRQVGQRFAALETIDKAMALPGYDRSRRRSTNCSCETPCCRP